MPRIRRNQAIDSDEGDDEPEGLPPPKTVRKHQKDNDIQLELPNRTRGPSERTLSAKQQAISKCFHCVPLLLYVLPVADTTFR